MILLLAFRHLFVRKLRAAFLLFGYAVGVGVMIVLLSVGEALVDQSRDVALVGGGEVTVLPEGIDVEAMRTGGLAGMFFGIDRARFVTRQVVGGPRTREVVAAVSPAIEGKLVYLRHRDRTVWVRTGGEVPSRAAAVGAGLSVVEGRWADSPEDSAWAAPTPAQLYDEIDRFHLPPVDDSTWGEWHYFNVVQSPEEWWYVSFLVGGRVGRGRWGGQLLVTHRRPDGRYQRFAEPVPARDITLDTAGAGLRLGPGQVRQADGVYRVALRAAGLRMDFALRPDPHRYFPPLSLAEGDQPSGYVVPALRARASGTVCVEGRCRRFDDVPAYHDHNWGVWRGVTWDWGAANGAAVDLLYGQLRSAGAAGGNDPVFLALVDSLGVWQVLRAAGVSYTGERRLPGGAVAPAALSLTAARGADSVRLAVEVRDAQATRAGAGGFRGTFLQMRGWFRLAGTVAGAAVADSGWGFFETWVEEGGRPEGR